jgi:hypothetical protein
MFNKSEMTILVGMLLMFVASFIFYFETRSIIAYVLLGIGFVLVGIGILLGFFKMVSNDKE